MNSKLLLWVFLEYGRRDMMVKCFKIFGLTILLASAGCSSVGTVNLAKSAKSAKSSNSVSAISPVSSISSATQDRKPDYNPVYPTMAVPLQPSIQREVKIAQLNQLLQRQDLNQTVRSKILTERGRYYDSLGLRDLARIDFSQSLKINPAQPDVFNLLGLYFTQVGEFDAAYEAFDSTLDLDPGNQDALGNRAIALYYGDRTELALEDMKVHYQNKPDDPFRALWLYIIESELDNDAATESLHAKYKNRSNDWGWVLVGIMLSDINEEDAIKLVMKSTRDNIIMAERLTEAYFYLGKRHKAEGDFANALSLYKLAISFNVYDYVEHGYSFLELGRIFKEYKAASKVGNSSEFVKVGSN